MKSHYLQGFSTIPGGCLGFLNHQQHIRDSASVFWCPNRFQLGKQPQKVFGSIPRDAKNFPPSDVIPLVPLLSFSCCAKHSKNSSKDSGDAGTSWRQWNACMSCPPSCSGLSKWNVIQALITIDATLVLMLLIYNFRRCVDVVI